MDAAAISSVASSARANHLPLEGAALRSAPPAEQRAAVAAQFEAILVRQLLGKTMTKLLDSGDGASASVYGDMLTDVLATKLTSGPGLGLGRMIEKQLTPRGSQPAAPATT